MLATHATDSFTSRLAQRKASTQAGLLVEHDCAMGNSRCTVRYVSSFSSRTQFWYLFLITPRVLALAMFAATFRSWFWIILAAHWWGMLFWILRFVSAGLSTLASTIDPLFLAHDILHQRPNQVQSSRGHLREVLQSRLFVHLHFLLHGMCPTHVSRTFESVAFV